MIYMLYLVLETSSTFGMIILYENNHPLAMKKIPSFQLSAALMKGIEEIFSENQKKLSDLSFIACGIGPGSFTGTRIGIVSTKALAYSLNLPIIDFCSLLLFMPENPPSSLSILSDARSGQIYRLDVKMKGSIPIFNEPILDSIEAIDTIEHPYSADTQLIDLCPKINFTNFNLAFLSQYLMDQFSKKEFKDALELKPIYLKSP